MKPLTSEDINESKATVSKIFEKTTTKPKIKEENLTDQNRNSNLSLEKLPRASDTFNLDMYKTSACSTSNTKTDLFSGLNTTVKTIDLNNIPSDSLSEVTIHKRNRSFDEKHSQNSCDSLASLSTFDAPKKKKYKIVPNSYVSPPSKNTESSPNSSSSPENKSPENSVNALNTTSELPKDRRELLKFVSKYQTKNISPVSSFRFDVFR